jgi:outer membrane protein TolC
MKHASLIGALCASLCVMSIHDAAAALDAVPSIRLDDALRYAASHQPRVRAALAELAARQADARVPRARWLPRIGATAQLFGATNNDTSAVYLGVPEVDLARTGATGGRTTDSASWRPATSTLAAISIDQQVYDFGRIAAQAAIADALTAIARADALTADLDIQLGVEEAFHGVLAAKATLVAGEDAYKRATTHRDFAKAGTKSGLRPPIDLTRAEADVARLGVRVVEAESGVRVARAALAASIGSDALEIDAEALAPDESAAPAFDEVLRQANSKNPVILAALARLDAQRATTRSYTRELLPNLFASAGLSGRAGGFAPASGTADLPYGSGWLPDVPNWHLGLVLSWNLYDGTIWARRAASRAREEVGKAEIDAARLDVTLGSQRAFVELDAARKVLPGLSQSVAAARANLAQADARFKAGLGTIIELADAEALVTDAEVALAIGQFNVARTRAALGRVMAQRLVQGRRP